MTDQELRQTTSRASRGKRLPPPRLGPLAVRLWRTMVAGVGLVRQVWDRFSRDGGSLMAAAIAFYGLILLIPLGALAVSVVGRVLGSTDAAGPERQVLDVMRDTFRVQAPAVEDAIRHFPRPTGSWFVEAISILGLLWAASRLFHTLEDVLTRVWSGHGRGRPLFLRNLVALAATVGAGLIFLVTMVTTTAAAALASREIGPGPLPALHWLAAWVSKLAPIAPAWLMFLLMYEFLPQGQVRWRSAAVGAAAAAIMWEISRIAFAALVTQSAAYGRLYGSLASTILVGFWIYMTAAIMLIGAELAAVLHEHGQTQEA